MINNELRETESIVEDNVTNKKTAFLAAFPHTLPVFTGYIVLGAAYGILMDSKGFSIFWILLASVFVYAGSMQFVAVALLAAGFSPSNAFLMTLMVNARHLFYGISMLDRYKGLGKFKPYLIFTLTDETFSILCSTESPEEEFFLFPEKRKIPKSIKYLADVLPFTIIGMLVVYCLKDISFTHSTHAIPEAISIVAIVALHLWKNNTLISIGGGSLLYMVLVQFVFVP